MYLFKGVLSPFLQQIHEAPTVQRKTKVDTTWLNTTPQQLQKLLRKLSGVQKDLPVGSYVAWKLMHPKGGSGWLICIPSDLWRVEKIHIPGRGSEVQRLGIQLTKATLRVPHMKHWVFPKVLGFHLGKLIVVSWHHGEPYGKAFQVVSTEFLKYSVDNTLSILAHRSGR